MPSIYIDYNKYVSTVSVHTANRHMAKSRYFFEKNLTTNDTDNKTLFIRKIRALQYCVLLFSLGIVIYSFSLQLGTILKVVQEDRFSTANTSICIEGGIFRRVQHVCSASRCNESENANWKAC